MKTFILLSLLQLAALITINLQLRKVIMNQTELAQAINDAVTQIQKGIDEVIAALQNAGTVTPEVQAAVDSLKAKAQALDDLNPDNP